MQSSSSCSYCRPPPLSEGAHYRAEGKDRRGFGSNAPQRRGRRGLRHRRRRCIGFCRSHRRSRDDSRGDWEGLAAGQRRQHLRPICPDHPISGSATGHNVMLNFGDQVIFCKFVKKCSVFWKKIYQCSFEELTPLPCPLLYMQGL